MMKSLLIANRGEIACRIIRTARRLGVRTVAVYSEADSTAQHVRMADEAVHIGEAPATASYLVGERIIAAARQSGAEAIHPGYGFLSENEEFARAVLEAGLIWVGAPPKSIAAMGLKDAAKTLMREAEVPITPGYLGEKQDPAFLAEQAAQVGYPVLIKAVAGGGGKGMRKVEKADDFADALASCQREAAASFGNAHVLIEKYIDKPRHIEVQIFGDSHGNIVHLFERDCSLQRRHQKVIEEAPAPGMDAETRAHICAIAVRAAQAVDYIGAGTVEFIADGSAGLRADRMWFMEMNTRLQVEHPVTEAISGVDLVEWQLRIACGEELPLRQADLSIEGWAMEARLYAEDPARGFLPSIGRLERLRFGRSAGGRIDSGVVEGDVVSPHYDPMIAKLIAHGKHREEARLRLQAMLERTEVWSVKSNAAFLLAALRHGDFIDGDIDTGLISRDGAAMSSAPPPSPRALARASRRLLARSVFGASGAFRAFRLNAPRLREAVLMLDGAEVRVPLGETDGTQRTERGKARRGGRVWGRRGALPSTLARGTLVRETLVREDGQVWLLSHFRSAGKAGGSVGDGAILAPMPGRIISVAVSVGERVERGQKLLTMEAMKMEHTLTAPFAGEVSALEAVAGAWSEVDKLLAQVTPTVSGE